MSNDSGPVELTASVQGISAPAGLVTEVTSAGALNCSGGGRSETRLHPLALPWLDDISVDAGLVDERHHLERGPPKEQGEIHGALAKVGGVTSIVSAYVGLSPPGKQQHSGGHAAAGTA